MRIALIAPFGLRAKGTTRARALPLARALARRGHLVALFIPPYDSPEDSGQRWRDGGVEVVNVALPAGCRRVPAGENVQDAALRSGDESPGYRATPRERGWVCRAVFGAFEALWYFRLTWRLLRAVRVWKPDVVHVFKPKGPSGLVGAALWATRGGRSQRGRPQGIAPSAFVSLFPCVPVSLSPRLRVTPSPRPLVIDSDDWEGPGGWNDDPRAGYSRLQRRFFAWQERFGLSHAAAWTVTGRCLRDRAISFGADPERVFVMPNGESDWVLGIRYWVCQYPIPNTQSLLLYTRFAGVLVSDVVALWEAVRARVPDATLTVVGRGLGGEERELAGLPGVEVAGWVEPEDLPALFARMTLAVVPWADTPANRARSSAKVLELMAAGLPVVAYAVGELPVTVGDGGVLVPAGDVEAFAAAVAGLLADSEQARALGAHGRGRVLREYNWDRLAEIALEAYAAGVGGG